MKEFTGFALPLLVFWFKTLVWSSVPATVAFVTTPTMSGVATFMPTSGTRRPALHHSHLRATGTLATNSNEQESFSSCDICVMGGGFGGLYSALQMAALQPQFDPPASASRRRGGRRGQTNTNKPLDIVLVDPGDRFVFLPLLYDLVQGTATRQEVCPPYRQMLQGTNIRFIQGTVQNVTTTTSGVGGGTVTIVPIKLNSDSDETKTKTTLTFQQGVVAVGATPQSVLSSVPGAASLTQPFYSEQHALETRELLQKLDRFVRGNPQSKLKLAVVGGGYGGVELAACLQRRFGSSAASLTLLVRSTPLQGTRAQGVVQQALKQLQINVELCDVHAVEPVSDKENNINSEMTQHSQVRVLRRPKGEAKDNDPASIIGHDEVWDAVFWTAGSGPAEPVSDTNALVELERIQGRLATDRTLQCYYQRATPVQAKPALWALGDCAQVIGGEPTPKTAQVAMQQADTVAYNVLLAHYGRAPLPAASSNRRRMPTTRINNAPRTFVYQDLGSMMNLGGTNGVIAAPPDTSTLGPVFAPLLDTARVGLNVADAVLSEMAQSRDKSSSPMLSSLSLSGYGLGGDDALNTSGSLAGTLAGAARRAVYAARMPTNQQRVYSAVSAALSTALTLAKEVSESSK